VGSDFSIFFMEVQGFEDIAVTSSSKIVINFYFKKTSNQNVDTVFSAFQAQK
jgi:hypothetical protein